MDYLLMHCAIIKQQTFVQPNTIVWVTTMTWGRVDQGNWANLREERPEPHNLLRSPDIHHVNIIQIVHVT